MRRFPENLYDDTGGGVSSTLPADYLRQLTQAGEEIVLEEAINQELFLLDALNSNIEESDFFKEEMERMRRQLLRGFAVQQALADTVPTEEEVRSYYEEHREEFREPHQVAASHILVDTEELACSSRRRENHLMIWRWSSNCPSKRSEALWGCLSEGGWFRV